VVVAQSGWSLPRRWVHGLQKIVTRGGAEIISGNGRVSMVGGLAWLVGWHTGLRLDLAGRDGTMQNGFSWSVGRDTYIDISPSHGHITIHHEIWVIRGWVAEPSYGW
jgi:hypothetical protein